MDHSVFRQKSMERITSPEQMNDYIRVSNPSVWMLLAAVIVLLIGVCVWGAFGHLDTVVQTGGICEDGRLTVFLSESDFAKLDGEAILSVGEAEYAVVSDVAGMPILLDESTDLICSISLGSPWATGRTSCRRRPPISRTAFIPYPLLSSASGPLISS